MDVLSSSIEENTCDNYGDLAVNTASAKHASPHAQGQQGRSFWKY